MDQNATTVTTDGYSVIEHIDHLLDPPFYYLGRVKADENIKILTGLKNSILRIINNSSKFGEIIDPEKSKSSIESSSQAGLAASRVDQIFLPLVKDFDKKYTILREKIEFIKQDYDQDISAPVTGLRGWLSTLHRDIDPIIGLKSSLRTFDKSISKFMHEHQMKREWLQDEARQLQQKANDFLNEMKTKEPSATKEPEAKPTDKPDTTSPPSPDLIGDAIGKLESYLPSPNSNNVSDQKKSGHRKELINLIKNS
jgi:hypothetical protein